MRKKRTPGNRANEKCPARRLTALLAGFALLCGLSAGRAEGELDLSDLLGNLDLEEVTIRDPSESLLAHDIEWHTPGEGSPVQCEHEDCYWKLPMGSTDEAAVWKVLTAPVTVLDVNQRHQYKVRKEPDGDCTVYTGEVTGASQGVHVLERGEEWTLIEAYSSSPEGSKVKVYAEKFQGYVETSLLKEVPVDQQYALVIDKQKQRLYVYEEGHLLSTLLCSTGYYNPKKGTRWNETPAGEFLCISWTGDFSLKNDDGEINMWCRKAIRINDGILIHEVPQMQDKEGNWTYDQCERFLGEKASHGCIRVQRQANIDGVCHKWLWEHLSDGVSRGKAPTKVIIWDDAGRTLGYPDDMLVLYYNPSKHAQYYHATPTCSTYVLDNGTHPTMEPFHYGQLGESPFSRLKPCPRCCPEPRKDVIDELNEENNR